MERRNFLTVLLGGAATASLASVVYPISEYLIPPPERTPDVSEVQVCKVGELGLNDSKVFQFGERAGILIKTPTGELKAFDATCTHLACTVQYRPEKADIWCACHTGVFDLEGKNVSGPPPRPLTPFKVTLQNGEITVSKIS